MSDPAAAPSTEQIALNALTTALPMVATIVGALVPGAAPVGAIAVKIAEGVIAAVPEAEALWAQFQSGAVPTQAQLDAYAASENTAYAQLMADIQAKLAAAGP